MPSRTKERRAHRLDIRLHSMRNKKRTALYKVIRELTNASTDYYFSLEPGDNWYGGVAEAKIPMLREFVYQVGRKIGQVYQYELYEMKTFYRTGSDTDKTAYRALWDMSSRYEILFVLDKNLKGRR